MSRPRLLRSTAVFSAMTFLSRIAGFARDVVQAALFGAGSATDAFTIAYRIPNYLRRIFAEGSFAMAFVPTFSAIKESGDRAALKDFLDHIAGALFAVVWLVSGLGMLAAPLIVGAIAPGTLNEPGKFELASDMLRIVFPYLGFISMVALAGGVLNSFGRFGLPAVTPVLHNLMLIAAMLFFTGYFDVPIMALAWGVLAAGFAQLLLLWPALGRLGLAPRPRINFRHEGVRRVFKLMLPTLFSSSVAQFNLIVGTLFASLLVTGSQTWLWYSDRLVEFPLGLFGVALGTVILPHLSSRFAATDGAGFSSALDWGLRQVLLLALPAALGLVLLAEPVVTTVFERGAFTALDSTMTAYAVIAMSLGIPFFMLTKVLAPAFFARQDTKTPMKAAIATVVANVVLTIAITTPLWLTGTPGAHAGIALATAIAGAVNAALLWRYLKRDGLYQPSPGWGRHLLRLMAGCVAMAVVVLALRAWIGEFSALGEWMRWGVLLGVVGAGAAAYGAGLLLTGWRPRELRFAG
ncbi:murein biosynthesis integral membrane protein MurJ [Alkalisalibacterium limincola]|uniref:Probable lipid II flippase MurJ n=1 Tax=Alkalisalibacterium limincola TaxID=2699169 RepID=A0A5C8KXE8_9GAMM|nr:murein biosynthesis integral membrane protein MurJ [Alkalisalibacterium limincola]TXK65920.1 murein biosynthesis integral membrane protein MurJ [Alkalisalibacterium limincola]